jgi:uncharacterized MAPEG superfamily protein
MAIELKMLVWAAALGLVQIALAATFATAQRGMAWGFSARDGEARPVTATTARLQRAAANFLETFAIFAALVLVLAATNRFTADTALAAQLYFWARVAYVPAYALGVPYLRTLVWFAAVAGIVMLLLAAL